MSGHLRFAISFFAISSAVLLAITLFTKEQDEPLDDDQSVFICAPEKKYTAQQIIDDFHEFSDRDVQKTLSSYVLKVRWYEMTFAKQLTLITSAADAEACLSDGHVQYIKFYYAGENVAEATPSNGIRVIKHRP